jgi:hypothetical protein
VRHRAARLAAQGLSSFALPVGAVTEEGMDVRIGDTVVGTGAIGTGKALGQNAADRATLAFSCAPGRHGDAGQSAGVRGFRSRSRAAVSVAIWWCSRCCVQCHTSQSTKMLSTRLDQNQSINIPFLVTQERDQAGGWRKDSEAGWDRQAVRRCGTELSTIDRGRTLMMIVHYFHLPPFIFQFCRCAAAIISAELLSFN